MSTPDRWLVVAVLVAHATCASHAGEPVADGFNYPRSYDFGQPIGEETRRSLFTTIPPDGEGLPDGSGTFDEGAAIYLAKCASCHGEDLQNAGRPLIGGRGSLRSDAPMKTVESFWPYATSVFSYVRNTMPVSKPGSLSDDEVYALMAFILGSAELVRRDAVMDRQALVNVPMPNRDGFVPDDRPDIRPAGNKRHTSMP